jgi:mannose/cellobiose epimerase-like protein (N-acyl-D-glucosamine 2-epimerase family)
MHSASPEGSSHCFDHAAVLHAFSAQAVDLQRTTEEHKSYTIDIV